MNQAQIAIIFRANRPSALGFTLLEMLVVLLLGSLLVGTVLPAMQRMHEAAQYKTARDALLGRLGELGYEAFASGRSMVLSSQVGGVAGATSEEAGAPRATNGVASGVVNGVASAPSVGNAAGGAAGLSQAAPVLASVALDLPPGWAIEVQNPIRFAFTGICEGGTVVLLPPGRAPERLRLVAPLCAVAADGS